MFLITIRYTGYFEGAKHKMGYSIQNHSRGYDISLSEGILAGLTLSGVPYALRHKELSEQQDYAEYRVWHRILMVAQCIPGIGLLAAIVERIIVYVSSLFNQKPNETEVSPVAGKPNTFNTNGNSVEPKIEATKSEEKPVDENLFSTELVTFEPYKDASPSGFGKLLPEVTSCIIFFLSNKDVYNLMRVEKTLFNRCKKIFVDDRNMLIYFHKSINLMFENGYNAAWTAGPYKEGWFLPENRELRHTDLKKAIVNIVTTPLFQGGICINSLGGYRKGMGGREVTLLLQAVEEITDSPKRLDVVRLLMEKGADPTLAVRWNAYEERLSPIQAAENKKDQALINLLAAS